ncbi:Transmembrane and coiled-coil domain-containing protein 4, partial [Mucuna pruriens]
MAKWARLACSSSLLGRSDKAGKVLAEVLLKGLQGNRPVTLVGFSLGARVIFKCLRCLADSKGDNAGIVEKVVLLGAPIPIGDENWEAARKMVAGRFVNAYSSNDWTLGVAFRASLLSEGLAGVQPVDLHGIENVDVTELIEGHSSYLLMTQKILEQLQLDNCYAVFKSEHENPQEEEKSAVS